MTMMPRKRLATPLGRIPDGIGRLAVGQHEADIPRDGPRRRDWASRGLDAAFKDSLLAKKDTDEAAAVRADAKL